MTHKAAQHSLSDWLALHELSPAACRLILDAAPSSVGGSTLEANVAVSSLNALDTEAAWLRTADAMRAFFPSQRSIIDDTFENVVRTFVSGSKPGQALTIDKGSNAYPTILYSFSVPSDFLVLAHEFGHALQIRASEGRFVSPIMREVCAFVSEWAQLSYAMAVDAAQHDHLAQLWRKDNCKYFGPGRDRLMSALLRPDLAYSYSWNYPIARHLSIRVQESLPRDHIWALFEGHISLRALLRDLEFGLDLA